MSGKTLDDITEGSTNLFASDANIDTWLTGKDPDSLTEGTTNLYYSETLATASIEGYFTAGTNIADADGGTDDYLKINMILDLLEALQLMDGGA